MSNTNRPLFQLRKELLDLSSSNQQSVSSDQDLNDNFVSIVDEGNSNSGLELYKSGAILTENEKFIIKSLNADPLNIINNPDLTNNSIGVENQYNNGHSQLIYGSIDTLSGKAMVNDDRNLYIWSYNTLQKIIPYNKIPINTFDNSNNEPPECLLTWPVTMDLNKDNSDLSKTFSNQDNNEFGICLIYKKTGKVVFYENVSTINNLNSKLSMNMAHILDLNFDGVTEFITKTISVEPTGIVVATSTGRVLYITLRDSLGNADIQFKQQLIGPKMNIFNKLFHFNKKDNTSMNNNSNNNNKDSITSLKNGPIVGKGERLLYIMSKNGDFQIWQLSLSTNCYQRVKVNVMNQILESLNDLYPFAYGSLKILDANPILSHDSNIHMILSSISDSNKTYYILSILIFDETSNNFTIFSTCRLNTYMEDNTVLPKLIIPNSTNDFGLQCNDDKFINIFVVFNDAVVLTQINSKFDINFSLRRKFEDIISFKDDVEIIGVGFNTNQLYLMSQKLNNILEISLKENKLTDDVRFVKSHIEQAIFFDDEMDKFIEFNLSKDIVLDNQTIEEDIRLCRDEIFHSKSKYLPSVSNLPLQNLKIRIKYFNNLIKFVKDNFNDKVNNTVKLQLIEKIEIMQCCYGILTFLDENKTLPIVTNWTNVLGKFQITVDELVVGQLDKFPSILTNFFTDIALTGNESLELIFDIIKLIENCVYTDVLEVGERKLRYDIFHLNILTIDTDKLPWFINLANLGVWNKMFFQYKFSLDAKKMGQDKTEFIVNEDIKTQFFTLLKIMYYCFNQVSLYASKEKLISVNGTEEYDELLAINKLYLENHLAWNQVLCEFGYQMESIQLTDFYKDLESLVETLETLPQDDIGTLNMYDEFFNKFQYNFASTLFEYYATRRQLQDLLFKFPAQRSFLVQFFEENIDQYGDIVWIQEILNEHYMKASQVLMKLDIYGNDLGTNKLHLNIAKLSLLAGGEDDVELQELKKLQDQIDLVEYELELLRMVDGIKMDKSFINTPYEVEFNTVLNKYLKLNRMVDCCKIIEFYTLIDDSTGSMLQQSLDLLTQVSSTLIPMDVRDYLLCNIWRRVILRGQFKPTLEHFISGKLYLRVNKLPTLSFLLDTRYEAVMKEMYGMDQWGGVYEVVQSEMKQVKDQYTEQDINAIISEVNESQPTPQIIDYNANQISVSIII